MARHIPFGERVFHFEKPESLSLTAINVILEFPVPEPPF